MIDITQTAGQIKALKNSVLSNTEETKILVHIYTWMEKVSACNGSGMIYEVDQLYYDNIYNYLTAKGFIILSEMFMCNSKTYKFQIYWG